jgi:hypothetical protein
MYVGSRESFIVIRRINCNYVIFQDIWRRKNFERSFSVFSANEDSEYRVIVEGSVQASPFSKM